MTSFLMLLWNLFTKLIYSSVYVIKQKIGGPGMRKLLIIIFLLTLPGLAFSETIWCKAFNAGCITEQQRVKQRKFCEQTSISSYLEAFEKASRDPTVWQFSGNTSAEDFARMAQRGYIAICLKNTSPNSF